MAFSIKDISQQIKALFTNLPAGRLIPLVILVGGTIAGFTYLLMWSGTPEYIPLYSNLSAEDTAQVVSVLKEQKIPYKLTSGGTVIQVPQNNLYDLRLDLASRGLPKGSGIGFEVFDNTKLGVTEFVQNVNYQRALQGELSRTINGLAEVESSRVHIVMSERSLFVEDEEPATASVILKLRNGRWLSKEQVQGIVHLVSSSVPRLKPEKVTIIDSDGDLLAGFKEKDSFSQITSDQLEFQNIKEKTLERRVKTMLESVLGQNNVIVRVSSDIDFVRQEKTEEMFFPDNQVVRSEQSYSELSNEAETSPEGIPGLASNITGEVGRGTLGTQVGGYRKQDNTRNYEIGKMVNHQVIPVGTVKRLSVAVVVDGTYKTTVTGEGEKAVEEVTYEPRTPEEITKLENLVKSAVNFNEQRGDKVEVVNIPFEPDTNTSQAKSEESLLSKAGNYSQYIKYIASAFFILFTFMFVLRPLIRWLTAISVDDIEMLEHLPKTIAELESEYANKPLGLNYTNQAAQLITANGDASAKSMQDWLREG